MSNDRSHLVAWNAVTFEESSAASLRLRVVDGLDIIDGGQQLLAWGLLRRAEEGRHGRDVCGLVVQHPYEPERLAQAIPWHEPVDGAVLAADGTCFQVWSKSGAQQVLLNGESPKTTKWNLGNERVHAIVERADGGWFLATESRLISTRGPGARPDWIRNFEFEAGARIAEAPNHGLLAVVGHEDDLHLLHVGDGEGAFRIPSGGIAASALCLHPTERRVMVAQGSIVKGWEFPEAGSLSEPRVLSGKLTFTLALPHGPFSVMAFVDEGRSLLVVGRESMKLLPFSPEDPSLRRTRETRRRARSWVQRLAKEKRVGRRELSTAVAQRLPGLEVDRDLAERLIDVHFCPRRVNEEIWGYATRAGTREELLWSEEALRYVVLTWPWTEHYYHSMAVIKVRLGKFEEALHYLDQADGIDEDDLTNIVMSPDEFPSNVYLRATANAKLGRETQARQAFQYAESLSERPYFERVENRYDDFRSEAVAALEELGPPSSSPSHQ